MREDIEKILFHETTILSRLDQMAADISADFQGKEITVIAILHGSLFFVADLLRRVHLPLQVESLNVSSYHGGTQSSGSVQFEPGTLPEIRHRHVLLVDDILDSGRTLHAIRAHLEEHCSPESIKICVLLDKKAQRACPVHADYTGFVIEDEFVVGYGLDYQGHYRNLPYIGTLKRELID